MMFNPAALQAQVSRELTRVFARLRPDRIVIGYSGGIDSSVLLHLVKDWLQDRSANNANVKESVSATVSTTVSVRAVYVNHGTGAIADEWEQHCRVEAERVGVPFASTKIDPEPMPKHSPEEELRIKRYAALKGFMRPGDVLLLAHHRDDQAETVLLQLLRGAGPKGLAGMPRIRTSNNVYVARPMLDLSRNDIEAFAKARQIQWVDDPSNKSTRYDRNYLRHRVIPALAERWQSWADSVLCASEHQAEMMPLLDEIADQLVQTYVSSDGALELDAAASLDDGRKKLLLRRWIQTQNLPSPSRKQLKILLETYLSKDRQVFGGMACWKNAQVRCYRRKLYAMKPLVDINTSIQKTWSHGTDLDLPEIKQRLSWQALRTQMPILADTSSLTVRFRQGGERYFYAERNYHQSLKKVFQQLGVPPWERNRIPLVYHNDELRLIWGYRVSGG